MLLSAYHTPPVIQASARPTLGGFVTQGPIAITDPCAWYGERSGAAAGEDLLRALYLLVSATTTEAGITEWRLDSQGRLVWTAAVDNYRIDWDSEDTLLPPEYLGLAPGTTGITTWTDGQHVQPYALPYLWGAGQDASLDQLIEHRQQLTEVTTRGYRHPVRHRTFDVLELEYDRVAVDRVLNSERVTPPGQWSSFEAWVSAAFGPPMLDFLYFDALSAQTVLTLAGEALDVTPWGPFLLETGQHGDQSIGRSYREEDTPERWRVIVDAEDAP